MNNNYTHKRIIHIDMDSFFASVEIRDNPKLKNLPVIIGGKSKYHGVVSTASYEARKYGIHSAMPTSQAFKLCPNAILIPTNMLKYKKVSKQIMNIFSHFSDKVEPMSLDEAYIDVTNNKVNMQTATQIAQSIQKEIKKKVNLTCSCGISYNKFLAKSASEINKPNGIFVITPKTQSKFMDNLKIQQFHGIGKKTAKKLISLGIYTGADLKKLSNKELVALFGIRGEYFYDIAHGVDKREVKFKKTIKSISSERTYFEFLYTPEELNNSLLDNFTRSYARLIDHHFICKTITIKIRDSHFKTVTKSKTLDYYTDQEEDLLREFNILLTKMTFIAGIRLFGIRFSNLENKKNIQKLNNKNYHFSHKFKQLSLNI